MQKTKLNRRGFTLIELLIVIGILGIIAAVVFVALDPGTRFADARDSRRWTDISAIIDAIKVNQVDGDGAYITEIADNMTTGVNDIYMIGTAATGCVPAGVCDVTVAGDAFCVDLTQLITDGHIGKIPVSPDNPDTAADVWDATLSGYTLQKTDKGIIIVSSCDSENTGSISITR
jgi:prepilin-type N-terminal cleavage/methylation domain-containing protein